MGFFLVTEPWRSPSPLSAFGGLVSKDPKGILAEWTGPQWVLLRENLRASVEHAADLGVLCKVCGGGAPRVAAAVWKRREQLRAAAKARSRDAFLQLGEEVKMSVCTGWADESRALGPSSFVVGRV